jgi:hypothetical protein
MHKHNKTKRELQTWTSSPIGGMLYPCLTPSHKGKRVPRSTHPRTKIQMLAMIEIDQKFRIRSDGREGSLTRSHGTHSSFFTIPKSPQQEAGGLWWCPLVCPGRRIQSNKTIRQLIHPCVQQLVLARKREMQLPGRAPCLDMSPLLTPTDKLEPCPAADGDGHRAEPLGAHAWIMDDGCMHAYLTD